MQKRKAQELTSSDRELVNENGRKKRYIEVRNDLWNVKGYENLGLKAQNLRDQASRLERIREWLIDMSASNSTRTTGIRESIIDGRPECTSGTDFPDSADLLTSNIQSVESDETEYANLIKPTRNDLHIRTTNNNTEFPREGEHMRQTEQSEEDNGSVPGCLLEYNNVNKPSVVTWGTRSDGSAIVVQSLAIIETYYEIVP